MRSGDGPFTGLGDIIVLNPNYTEQDDYWLETPGEEAEE